MAKMVLIAAIVAAIYYLVVRPRPKTPGRAQTALSEAEARETLGVGADADSEQIRAAHRRLLTALHPDKGGSAALTRRINAARDRLLQK